jgi:hypothetical protein
MRLTDGADLNEFIAFKRSECTLKYKNGEFLTKLKCKSADNNRKAFFKRHPLVPDLFKFVVKAKKLSLLPFQVQELTGVLTTSSVDRPDPIGVILPCEIKTKKISRIRCDEPTGF